MTLEELRHRKIALGYTNQKLSELTGIPVNTIQRFFAGKTKNPRPSTLRALEHILLPRDTWADHPATDTLSLVHETLAAYGIQKKPGEYTLEDYLLLPDDQRVELIDGAFYDMAAPKTWHQAIAGYIYKQFLDHVMEHKGPCFPFMSPVDVQLDADDKTVVQPDVLVVCDREKYKNGRIYGAPDLVIEVLSPSTRKKDMQLKYHKYGNAGVREYWIVDPSNKTVIQYNLVDNTPPAIYSFSDTVPVLIWVGACLVDFKEMYDLISFLMEDAESILSG